MDVRRGGPGFDVPGRANMGDDFSKLVGPEINSFAVVLVIQEMPKFETR